MTANFDNAWNAQSREATVLLEVALTTPSAQTVRLGTRGITAAGRSFVGAIVDPGTITSPGAVCTTSPCLVTANMTLAASALGVGGTTLRTLTGTHIWVGAKATVWLWPTTSTGGTWVWADAKQVFSGVIQTIDTTGDQITIGMRQRIDWNRPVTPVEVTVNDATFPQAPQESVGEVLPTYIGQMVYPAARSYYHHDYDYNYSMTPEDAVAGYIMRKGPIMAYGGRNVGPALVVSVGTVNDTSRIAVAGHQVHQDSSSFGEDPGCGIYIRQGSVLDPCYPEWFYNSGVTGGIESGAGFYLKDGTAAADALGAFHSLFPTEVEYTNNMAANWRGLLEKWNDDNPAITNYGSGKYRVHLKLSSPGELGSIARCPATPTTSDVWMLVAADCTHGSVDCTYAKDGVPIVTLNCAYGGTNPDTPFWFAKRMQDPALGLWESWQQLTDGGVLRIEASGTGSARIYAATVVVRYVPSEYFLGMPAPVLVQPHRRKGNKWVDAVIGPSRHPAQPRWETRSPLGMDEGDMEGAFYANIRGWVDAAGTYTGTVGAVIERPCDVVRFALQNYGGEAAGSIATGAEVGSFVSARTLAQTGNWTGNAPMRVAMAVSKPMDVGGLMEMVCESFLSSVFLSPYDDKWRYIVWGRSSVAAVEIPVDFIGQPTVTTSADTRVVSMVTVKYANDSAAGATTAKVMATGSKSVGGYKYNNRADFSSQIQNLMLQAATEYISPTDPAGLRREALLDSRCIQDTDTALEVRNRLAYLRYKPSITLRFAAEKLVGLERGTRIKFPAAMNTFFPYPDHDTDRLWVGKELTVVETELHLGPDSYYTEVVAAAVDCSGAATYQGQVAIKTVPVVPGDGGGDPEIPGTAFIPCSAVGEQLYPVIISDGGTGSIVAWVDARTGTGYNVYAQKLNTTGAPQWAANGVLISSSTSSAVNYDISMVSDGAGGAIIGWTCVVGSANQNYYRRILTGGTMGYAQSPMSVLGSTGSRFMQLVVSATAGNAIAVWRDTVDGETSIYAARVLDTGSLQWGPTCIRASAQAIQTEPVAYSDGANGAYVVWKDYSYGVNPIISANLVRNNGALPWGGYGVPVSMAAYVASPTQMCNKRDTRVVLTGADVIIAWVDDRSGKFDVYAQRLTAALGARQFTGANLDGQAVCTVAPEVGRTGLVMCRDNASGAICAWVEEALIDGHKHVRARRFSATMTYPWGTGATQTAGQTIDNTSGQDKSELSITPGADSGAVIAWMRTTAASGYDIRAQRVVAAGTVQWTANGLAVCISSNNQTGPVVVGYPDFSYYVCAWSDNRSSNADIYAARVSGAGVVLGAT